MIQLNKKNIRLLEGDFKPASGYVGNKKAGGWETASASGQELEIEDTYNSTYDEMKVYGKSEQKADWSQAEGETSQAVTQQGENLWDFKKWAEEYAEATVNSVVEFDGRTCLKIIGGTASYPLVTFPEYVNHFKFDAYSAGYERSFFTVKKDGTDVYYVDPLAQNEWFSYHGTETFNQIQIYAANNADTPIYIDLDSVVVSVEDIPYEPFVPDSPSPEYPSEMTSIIPAGSYQIPTENGIYEVTLEEPLRGLGEYRDKLCFDSVSGKGYLERAIGVKTDLRVTALYYGINRNEKCAVFYSSETTGRMPGDTPYLCSHFEQNDKIFNDTNYIEGIWLHTSSLYPNAVYVKLRKERLDLTDNTTVINSANTFLATLPTELLYVLEVPVRSSLTFTKVENSTAPVLPWTAYGENLFDLESLEGKLNVVSGAKLTYLENGYRIENQTDTVAVQRYAMQTNANPIQLEPNTDYTLSFDFKVLEGENWGRLALCRNYFGAGNVNFLVYTVCNVSRRYSVVFNSGETTAAYLYFSLNNTETAAPIKKEYTNITLTKGLGVSPPESLAVSPDYPRQIYDLTDVTVTSRGRNLFDAEDWYTFLRSYTTTFVSKVTLDGYECIKYQPNGTHDKPYMQGQFKPNTQYTIKYKGRQDAVHEDTSSGFMFWYTDGTSMKIYVENTTEWKEYIATSAVGKTLDRIQMGYNYGYPIYIVENSIQLVEGAYTADTIPVCDRYRCTSVEIPVLSRAIEISEELYGDLPQGHGRYQENGKYYVCDYVQIENGSVKYVKCITEEILDGTVSFGDSGGSRFFSGGFAETFEKDYLVYCASTHLPGITHSQAYYNQAAGVSKMDGVISIAKQGIFADMTADEFNAWLVQQNNLGMPMTVYSVLQTPTQTDYTSQDWGEDMLSLRTAPYYTELFTDKETGGIDITYKTFNGGE